MTRRSAVALAGMLILSGCVVARVDIAVDPDGTVDGTASIAYRTEFLEASDLAAGEAQDALLTDLTDDGVDGMTCVPFRDAETVGASCTLADVPIAELSQLDVFDRRLAVARAGDRIVLDSVIDLTEFDSGTGGDLDAVITVGFAGPIIEQSGGTVDGTNVSWTPRLGERLEADAVAGAEPRNEPSGVSPEMVAVVAVVVAAVGATGFMLGRRRRVTGS